MPLSQGCGQLKKYQRFAEKLAIEAGEVLLKHSKKIEKLEVHSKEAQGVASTADLASEKHIVNSIKKAFPNHLILSEEDAFIQTDKNKKSRHQRGYSWIIDPLDGTNNFLTGLNYYAVCISLSFDGEPVVGVVYRPTTGECYSASKDNGAYLKYPLDDRRAKKLGKGKGRIKLKDAVVATGFFSEKGEQVDSEFAAFRKIVESTRAVRRIGSAALDMCLVAQGIFDGFWEVGLAAWDVAAAGVICLEAGVKVTDFHGRQFNPFDQQIVVGGQYVSTQLRTILLGYFPG